MTKMFYLTKFRFMHKHDSLSLTFQTLAIKTKPTNQPSNQPSSLVQNSEDAKDEESTALLQIYTHICTYVYTSGRPLLCWPCRLSVTVSHVTSGSLLHLPKIFNAVIIHLWPLFLNDIDYVICEVSLNDDLVLPCY